MLYRERWDIKLLAWIIAPILVLVLFVLWALIYLGNRYTDIGGGKHE